MKGSVGIELFCGCGGLSTGFLDAGLHVAAGFDIDRRSIEAYEFNHIHRGGRGHTLDLSRASGSDLLSIANIAAADFILGGPPCQPFSIAGKRGGRQDHRAGLVDDFLRLTRELRPAALFFENVPNLATVDDGNLLQNFVISIKRLGYRVDVDAIPAAEFGVPQTRRRLLIIGLRDVDSASLPEPTHGPGRLPYVTAREALDDLPPAADYGECRVYNHEPTEHTPAMLERFATLLPGKREPKSFHDRLHPDRPAYTLRAGTGNFSPLRPVHYQYDRVITVRESARIQSFKDDFIWPDWIPRLQQYRQVGNAVPPLVAWHVAMSMAAQLGWRTDPASFIGTKQDRPSAIAFSDEERRAMRRSRMRGASLGNNGKARRHSGKH
jgi:DNA (cytosine-5)-methyltransferase 1